MPEWKKINLLQKMREVEPTFTVWFWEGLKRQKKLYKKTGKRGTKKIRTKKKIQNKNKSQTSKKKLEVKPTKKLEVKPTKNIKN